MQTLTYCSEGVSSNISGSLIIKPCTQAEIDFYQSASSHEHFRAQIPDFVGTLTLQSKTSSEDLPAAASLEVQSNGVARSPPTRSLLDTFSQLWSRGLTSLRAPDEHSSVPTTTSVSSKRASWKPSGGKKLDTGLAIVLENITAGFTHPNIMDVKLGARLWADDAPASKRRKLDEVSKETTSGSLGFRIAGMKMYIPPDERQQADEKPQLNGNTKAEPDIETKDDYRMYNKNYGRHFSSDNVKDGFIEYLGGAHSSDKSGDRHVLHPKRPTAPLVLHRLIREVESVEYVLEHEESRMYSASILLVYEADESALRTALDHEQTVLEEEPEEDTDQQSFQVDTATLTALVGGGNSGPTETTPNHHNDENDSGDEEEDDDDDDDDPPPRPKVQDVRLIDFAHAAFTPGQGPDENALQGVRSVLRILREIADAVEHGP